VGSVAALASLAWYAAASLDAPDEPWPARLDDQQFWAMVQRFSEPGRTFDPKGGYRSDNLVSNERSLQQIIPALLPAQRSGAYLGVGPEQNFTYVTALEPSIAFVIDIRRENLLLHLMYKALAQEAADRVEFLAGLFARARPSGLGPNSSIESIFAAFERSPRSAELGQRTLRTIVHRLRTMHGSQLSPEDGTGIAAVYSKFVEAGPGIRWDPTGGSWIPSYADLMAQVDPQGRQRSYLASEETFQVFRRYQLRNRIVPLVGDLGGTTTLPAVGRYLSSQGAVVTAFYTSNVEVYLGDALQQFVANVAALPRDEHSMFIRTRFNVIGFTRDREDYKTTTTIELMREYLDSWRTTEGH
jgi:hypothetical protein